MAEQVYLTTRKETMENDNLNAINSHNFVNYALIVVHKTTHTRCSMKIKDNWIIKCENDNLFWNNQLGWVDYSSSDIFNQQEKNTLNLPVEGQWVKKVNK